MKKKTDRKVIRLFGHSRHQNSFREKIIGVCIIGPVLHVSFRRGRRGDRMGGERQCSIWIENIDRSFSAGIGKRGRESGMGGHFFLHLIRCICLDLCLYCT